MQTVTPRVVPGRSRCAASYAPGMKVAVSVPEDVFEEAEPAPEVTSVLVLRGKKKDLLESRSSQGPGSKRRSPAVRIAQSRKTGERGLILRYLAGNGFCGT